MFCSQVSSGRMWFSARKWLRTSRSGVRISPGAPQSLLLLHWPSTCFAASMQTTKAWLIGGGVGSLAAAAFLIRDGAVPGENITILEALPLMGGSLDGAGDPAKGYSLRGGRMLTTDNYECTWDLFNLNSEVGRGRHRRLSGWNLGARGFSVARLCYCRRQTEP